jgi:hypothetical protein
MNNILESVKIINEEIIKISKEDPLYGSMLFNAMVFTNNMMQDIIDGNGTDYIAAFKALSGVDIMDIVKESVENLNFDVEEEVLEFITGDSNDINIYKNKLNDLRKSLSNED